MNKTNFQIFGLLFFLVVLISCSEDYTKDKVFLDTLSKDFLDNKKQILIIPAHGCPGCRNQTLDFMKQNIGNQEIGFVLTTRKSLKDIRLMLMSKEIDLWDKKFAPLFLDKEGQAYKAGIMDIFPILYHLENQEIKEKQVLSASYIDEALNDLGLKSQLK